MENLHKGHRERLRQSYIENGPDGMHEHQLLELLLTYAIPRRDTNPIAHALMERYGSLAAVLDAPAEDLQKVEGVGESAAVLLKLVPQLYRKARLAEAERETVLNSSERAGAYLLERFAGEKHEVVYALYLDRKGKLIACRRLGEGGISSAGLDIRRLLEQALLTSASAVILSHNHPSGIALPSREDYATTQWVQEALRTIGVELLDHIIVAENDYVSLADSGILQRRQD